MFVFLHLIGYYGKGCHIENTKILVHI